MYLRRNNGNKATAHTTHLFQAANFLAVAVGFDDSGRL
jgi:hypothetical protein